MTTNLQQIQNFTLINEDFCEHAYSFRKQKLIVISVFAQTIINLLTILFTYLILFKSKGVRRVWSIIELDLKIITAVGFICYFAATISTLLVLAYKSILLGFDFPKCTYIWKGRTCYFAQVLNTGICVTSYTLFHFFIYIERSFVAFINSGQKLNGLMGVISGVIIFILSFIPQKTVLKDRDLNEPRLYCVHFFSSAETDGITPAIILLIFDMLVTCGDVCLYYYNKRQIKIQKSKSRGFDLQESFFLRQMQISVKIIYPYSILHSITYAIQIIVYVWFIEEATNWSIESLNLFYEIINLIRGISNLLLFVFIWVHAKQFAEHFGDRRIQTSNEADLFFKEFQRIIS